MINGSASTDLPHSWPRHQRNVLFLNWVQEMRRRKEGTSCCLGRVKSVNIRLLSTCAALVLCLEGRQLMRMSRAGCTAAHLLLPTTFSLQMLRADKERTVGKNYPPPSQNKDELAKGCVQCSEAGRGWEAQQRPGESFSQSPTSPKSKDKWKRSAIRRESESGAMHGGLHPPRHPQK